MASVSVQARIDSEVWEAMRKEGETNTQVLQRVASHYLATSANELGEIAPTPAAAIAVLFQSYKQLNMLLAHAAIALPQAPTTPAQAEPTTQEVSAIECADDW